MSKAPSIERIVPEAAIPGGEIAIDLAALPKTTVDGVTIDGFAAHMVAASRSRILALVPSECEHGEVEVSARDRALRAGSRRESRSFGRQKNGRSSPSRGESGLRSRRRVAVRHPLRFARRARAGFVVSSDNGRNCGRVLWRYH